MALPTVFGPRAVKQINDAIRKVGGTIQNPAPAPRARWSKSGSKRAVILDEALPAAGNSMTSPNSALATVLEWDGEKYTETDEQITVFNHSEVTAYEPDTFGFSEVIDGHECFGGDCAPMKDRG